MTRHLGLFARLAAVVALVLLVGQLALVANYLSDRRGGDEPGYRFPLPERIFAMARLVEEAADRDPVLVALNGPNLRVDVADMPFEAMVPGEDRLPRVEALFDAYARRLGERPVAVYVAFPPGTDTTELRRGDTTVWTRYPVRMLVGLEGGAVLTVETRDDLVTQIYALPIGWWSGVFAAVAAVIVLFFLRRETRPLVRLARAAERFGQDGDPRAVKPGGAREVRSLILSFNEMQDRIADLLIRRRVMLGALGHDLRTYLTRLRLKSEDLPEPVGRTIERDLVQMERILESCLELSAETSSSGRPEDIRLATFLKDYVAHRADNRISYDGGPDPVVSFDPVALDRILTNLIDNGLKFGTHVTLATGDAPPSVAVCDDGEGIAPEDAERVFEPFYTGEAARTLGKGGSGLGLSISRHLAEAGGARLNLARNGARGTRATLQFHATTG